MVHKTLHRKLNIEQHEPHLKPGVNSGTPEESFFSAFWISLCQNLWGRAVSESKIILRIVNGWIFSEFILNTATEKSYTYIDRSKVIYEQRNGQWPYDH